MELVRMSLGAGAGAGADADADAATARFADLRERVRNCLDVARSGARRAGFDDQQIETALFAVLAWIDEEAMTRDWAGASAWRRTPLQHEQFATNRAGALFFERLAALPLTAHAVREVYALVLLAGFTGRYAARPVAELDTLRAAQLDLLAAGAPPLAAGQPLFAPGAVLVATKAPRRVRAGLRRHRLAPILLFVVPVALLGGLYTAYALALARQAARLVAG
jgi:type VI secretion system protein ImpK